MIEEITKTEKRTLFFVTLNILWLDYFGYIDLGISEKFLQKIVNILFPEILFFGALLFIGIVAHFVFELIKLEIDRREREKKRKRQWDRVDYPMKDLRDVTEITTKKVVEQNGKEIKITENNEVYEREIET